MRCRQLNLRSTEVLPLYARLSSAEQHKIFERAPMGGPGRRIVLATNVAETSLTVPGVRYVVDTGTARISRYSRRLKVQRLPIEAGLAGVGQPTRRSLRARRAGYLHPTVQRGRLRRSARVHRPRDPAHQPGVGHPPDDGDRPRRRRPVPVRRAARPPHDPRRLRPARRTRRAPGTGRRREGRTAEADEGRPLARSPPGRPAARADGARSRSARLCPRGAGDRVGAVDPGSTRAPAGQARAGQRVPQPLQGRRLRPAVDRGAVGLPAHAAARAVGQPVPADVPQGVPQLPAGA